jgi:prolyl-tRNA synthetase
VHICGVRSDTPEVKEYAEKLYESLLKQNVEVVYDDRQISAGVMFSDADLVGAPIRVVVSPRNMKENIVEIAARDKSFALKTPLDEAEKTIIAKIGELKKAIADKVK